MGILRLPKRAFRARAWRTFSKECSFRFDEASSLTTLGVTKRTLAGGQPPFLGMCACMEVLDIYPPVSIETGR
eukprot:11209700-Lingulodinium_polyedra.AAC.1